MYHIFFKVDEILREEGDFTPDDDDLLDDEHKSNDHEMTDADNEGSFEDIARLKVHLDL